MFLSKYLAKYVLNKEMCLVAQCPPLTQKELTKTHNLHTPSTLKIWTKERLNIHLHVSHFLQQVPVVYKPIPCER